MRGFCFTVFRDFRPTFSGYLHQTGSNTHRHSDFSRNETQMISKLFNLIHHSEFINQKDYLDIRIFWSVFSKDAIKDCLLKDTRRQWRMGTFWGITWCSRMENYFWKMVIWIWSRSDKSVRTWCSAERTQCSLVERQNEQSRKDIKTSCFIAIWFPALSRAAGGWLSFP